jgi:hypothetical protein
MPRVFFTGRRKLPRRYVTVVLRRGRPPEFDARIDCSHLNKRIARDSRVVVEAYHNTMVQRFDFGTVGDCRAREPLRLTNFDEWDWPRFRVRVIGIATHAGIVLAECDRVQADAPEVGAEGGRSKLL